MKIILLGYMGSGKSTIAHLLSEKLQLPFKDLDSCIESRAKMTISTLFELKGEIFFRKLEQQVFQDLLSTKDSFVLSLGGGTPCYANNHKLLKGDGIISIYLKATVEQLLSRMNKEKGTRPLLANKSDQELKEFIAQHLFERSYFYYQATYTINTDMKSPKEIASEIKNLLI